jgi:pleiotropic regulator 1
VWSLLGHDETVINTVAVNDDGVLVSGGDDGSLKFWDYRTGYHFQWTQSKVQPGSLEAENGIVVAAFDHTGTRLVTGEADKTIKIYKPNDTVSEMPFQSTWLRGGNSLVQSPSSDTRLKVQGARTGHGA